MAGAPDWRSSTSILGSTMPRRWRRSAYAWAIRLSCSPSCATWPAAAWPAQGLTDAAAAHLAAGGLATLQIQIPRRYSHSPVEVLDLRDLAAALALTEELALHPPTAAELAFLSTPERPAG